MEKKSNKIIKNYLIPTNNWLKPIKLLAKTTNQIYDSELIESETKKRKILVKVIKTPSIESNAEFIYSIIKDSSRIVKIYNFITCWENPITLNQEYKNALGFCEGGPLDQIHKKSDNQMVHLELMKKYTNSLNEFIDELSLKKTIKIIRQIICIQLELFCSYGFIHGDIHSGNILVSKCENHTDIFLFCGETKSIEIDVGLFLTDFEYSKIYSQKLNEKIKIILSNPSELKITNSIQYHIISTFREFIHLIKNINLQNELSEKLEKWIETEFTKIRSKCEKPLYEYANKTISEYLFISKGFYNSMEIASQLFNLLFNVEF